MGSKYPFTHILFDSQRKRDAGNGRDTGGTVTDAPRSIEAPLWYANYDYLNSHRKGDITAELVSVKEVEMEEMWSFVGDKSHQYWLWWAIDHDSGELLAFHFGTREHENPDELLALPAPFDIKVIYCNNNYAYQSRVKKSEVKEGKREDTKDRKETPVVEDMEFPAREEGHSFFQRLSYAQNRSSSHY